MLLYFQYIFLLLKSTVLLSFSKEFLNLYMIKKSNR